MHLPIADFGAHVLDVFVTERKLDRAKVLAGTSAQVSEIATQAPKSLEPYQQAFFDARRWKSVVAGASGRGFE